METNELRKQMNEVFTEAKKHVQEAKDAIKNSKSSYTKYHKKYENKKTEERQKFNRWKLFKDAELWTMKFALEELYTKEHQDTASKDRCMILANQIKTEINGRYKKLQKQAQLNIFEDSEDLM